MSAPAFRVWVGWRAASMRGPNGWSRFSDALGKTFIPATWMVMQRYGLRAYVPSVTQADPPRGCPEETALLVYETPEAYERHKATVGGRSYGQMHGAVFGFDPPGISRSGWAAPGGVDPEPRSRLPAWFWDGTNPALALDSPGASIVFLMLGHDATAVSTAAATALHASLGYDKGQVVLCPTPTFTLAWIAVAPPGSANNTFATALAAALPQGAIHSQHVAKPADTTGDYFDGPDSEVPVSDQLSLRFLR